MIRVASESDERMGIMIKSCINIVDSIRIDELK